MWRGWGGGLVVLFGEDRRKRSGKAVIIGIEIDTWICI